MPSRRDRRLGDAFDPREIGGKAGHGDPVAPRLHQLLEIGPDGRFRARLASTKTLGLSHTMASAPSSPMRCRFPPSVTSPSRGSGSILQSAVWNHVPNL